MEILKVEHLVKQYGKGDNAVLAVNDISFSVEQGEFVAIVGSSGSGKSTLLHLLGGVDRPTSGKVYIQGEDIYSLNSDKIAIFRRRQVGLIYQFYNLIPILNVKENITLPCELDGRTPDKKELCDLINTLGLKDRVSHLPNQLSGGQQQRVAIARALAMNPKMLFFDEPTSALDPEITAGILKLLRELANEKMTMVIVTHEIDFARNVADRVIFMDGGVIVEEGKPQDVIDNPKSERTKAFLQKMA